MQQMRVFAYEGEAEIRGAQILVMISKGWTYEADSCEGIKAIEIRNHR